MSSADADKLTAFPFDGFHGVLQTHVDTEGRCGYRKLKKDSAALKRFTATVAVVGPDSTPKLFPSPAHKFAYYIDAYNSLAMLNALERTPNIRSLKGIRTDFFYRTSIRVDDDKTDLYTFENDVIRPAVRSHYVGNGQGGKLGRIHFALNCASASCPKLPNEVFRPETLEAQLDRETRRFVTASRNVSVDHTRKVVSLSKIFDWYKDDFTDNNGEAINPIVWINAYRPPDGQLDPSYRAEFFDYDWTLNDTSLNRL